MWDFLAMLASFNRDQLFWVRSPTRARSSTFADLSRTLFREEHRSWPQGLLTQYRVLLMVGILQSFSSSRTTRRWPSIRWGQWQAVSKSSFGRDSDQWAITPQHRQSPSFRGSSRS